MSLHPLDVRDTINGTCSLSYVVQPQTANDQEGTARTSFWIGVILSIVADAIVAVSLNVQKTAHMRNEGPDGKPKKSYWRIPLWWLGLLLNMGGEVGNMIAYGFAPASVVAPVGSVGVFFNEVIAVVFLKEPFRRRDALGLVGVVAGVVLIILAIPEDGTPLNAAVLVDTVYSNPVAYGYLIVLLIMVLFFMFYLEPRYAQRSIFVWLLLCSMISSVTVICARGWSSMLTRFVAGDCSAEHCVGYKLFQPCALTVGHWLFWVLIALVVATAIWSATFLNKAMMIYGNTEVVPVYYCTFTLISIIGGAVVYREFAHITIVGGIMFGLGCLGAFAGVYLITTGRKVVTRKGNEVIEEEELRFCRLTAVDRATELQRQRRTSIQPVGAPLVDILSFRRDDQILTGVDSIAEEVASEMYAGEHLQAAYRVRDSMGSQAAVVAGLRRLSQRISLGVPDGRRKSSMAAGTDALHDMRPPSLVLTLEDGCHPWSPGSASNRKGMFRPGVRTPITPAKLHVLDMDDTFVELPPAQACVLDALLSDDSPLLAALCSLRVVPPPLQSPHVSHRLASPLGNALSSPYFRSPTRPRSAPKRASQAKLSPVCEPGYEAITTSDAAADAAAPTPAHHTMPAPVPGASPSDITELVICITGGPAAEDPSTATRTTLRRKGLSWSSRVDVVSTKPPRRRSIALATCGGAIGSGGSTASTASTASHRNQGGAANAPGDTVRRLSLLAEINEDVLGTPHPRTDGLPASKLAPSLMPHVQSIEALARTPAQEKSDASVAGTAGQASPEGTDTSPQSSSSSAVSAADGEVHHKVPEHI